MVQFWIGSLTRCLEIVTYLNYMYELDITRGTGMIASSSTFCPHPGRVIMDLLFRLLHAVRHGT